MRAERRRERFIWSKETDNDFIRRMQFTLGFAGTGVDDERLERNHGLHQAQSHHACLGAHRPRGRD